MQPNPSSSETHQFDPLILREYDIRGQLDKNLSEDDAYLLGQAFGTYLHEKGGKSIAVGYDGRLSSPALCAALSRGLMETGADITHIGLGPTPMMNFAVKELKTDAGIMITGSHNPADYNGFKMTLLNEPVFGEIIQYIGQIAAKGDFTQGQGSETTIDIQDRYVERLLKDLTNTRPMKIAWDIGNGAAGEIVRRLTAKLPGEHILLFDEIDGTFPNHHPDPTVDKNLVDLQRVVEQEGCDLGIAFDGDGDRIGVVNERCEILRCDMLMTIYADEVLASHPGASIIGDIKCSQVMFDEIAKKGGNPVLWKTGHSLIKSKMLELKAPLAGELSGHIFFADKYYGFDDAIYCAIRLMNAVPEAGLSFLTADLPEIHNTPEARFEVPEEVKFDIVPQILANMKSRDDCEISDIDGIRVTTPEGWWLLRPSNTQSVLVARAEANSAQALERLTKMAQDELSKIGDYIIKF